MTPPRLLKLTKLDAARRQLETAVRLWFYDGDPVSVHTLTAAAAQIINGIAKKRGFSLSVFYDIFFGEDTAKAKTVRTAICRPENFFKHSEKDDGKTLDFMPQGTEIYLFDAVETYGHLDDHYNATLEHFLFILSQ